MMLLTGMLMPPIGLIAFVVARLTGIPLGKVFMGILPFCGTLCVAILLLIFFPGIATWLPNLMK
jgi:TRAP-type C4-dicarboxylate transport system permease large subunit